MSAHITVMLAVPDGTAAIDFYQRAFNANLLWKLGEADDVVAGLEIQGAKFFLAKESPEFGTRAPQGFTTIRVELFVDDPHAVHAQAVSAGCRDRSAVKQHEFNTAGPKPFSKCSRAPSSTPTATSGSLVNSSTSLRVLRALRI